MRRVTSALLTALCLCGSAFAQPGNLPPVAGGQFQGSAHGAGSIGRPDVRGDLSSRASIGLPSRAGGRGDVRPGAQFGAGGDLRSSVGGGFGHRVEGSLSAGAQLSAERRHPHTMNAGLESRAGGSARADQAFDPETGGLTAEGRAELMLRNRLAAIDRLRDAALEHGDSELLDEADRLEAQARERFVSRARIAGPPHSSLRTADFETDHAVSAGVTQTSGHPIGGFDTDSAHHGSVEGREFGLGTAANAAAQGREFGAATSTAARAGETSGYGAAASSARVAPGEWYDVQGQQRARGSHGAETSSRYGVRVDSRGSAAADFGHPQFDSRADLETTTSGEVHFEPKPFMPRSGTFDPANRGAGVDASANSGAEVSPHAFQRQLAAEASLHGNGSARHSASGGIAGHPLGTTDSQPAQPVHPLSYEVEDENTIYFGRQGTPAAAEYGQATAAEARAGRREFGQTTAAEARAAGRAFGQDTAAEAHLGTRSFGQSTASEARAGGRDFGQSTAAEARAGGRDFGQMTATDAGARGAASGGTSLFPGQSAGAEPAFDGAAEAEVGAKLASDDQRSGPKEPAAPSRTEKPRKRGLFSWFRGRSRAEAP